MDNATCLPAAEPIARATSKASPPGRVGFGTELLRATAAEPPGPARPIAGAKMAGPLPQAATDHVPAGGPASPVATVGAEPSTGPAAAPEEFADPPAPAASTDEPSADATPRTGAEAAAAAIPSPPLPLVAAPQAPALASGPGPGPPPATAAAAPQGTAATAGRLPASLPPAGGGARCAVPPGEARAMRGQPMPAAAEAGQAAALDATAEGAQSSREPTGPDAAPDLPAGPRLPTPPVQAAAPGPVPVPDTAALAGLSPPPATAPAEIPAPAAPRRAPPAPPARQVAQVSIALALGSGQAPRLTVALEPETLGRVEIRIERSADGAASSVQVLAERPETLALLQRDAGDLGRALGQAGIAVAGGALQFGLATGGQGQGGQGWGGQSGSGQRGGGTGHGPRPSSLAAETVRPLALSLLDIAV